MSQFQGFTQELWSTRLAVLLALAQLDVHHKAFDTKVGDNRCISIVPLVGPADAFLVGFRIIQWRNVDVQWYQPVGCITRKDAMGEKKLRIGIQKLLAQCNVITLVPYALWRTGSEYFSRVQVSLYKRYGQPDRGVVK